MAVAVAVADQDARAVLVLAVAEAPSNVLVPSRQGPDGMPQRVVGSRASPSVLCWAPWLDALLANSTGASLALMAEAMAPGLEHPNGQAAQASSPSSWGSRNPPQGCPAESPSGLEHRNGQAAQASSPSSWGGSDPQGSRAEPSSCPTATARMRATPDDLQMVQPTVILKQVACEEHERPLQA